MLKKVSPGNTLPTETEAFKGSKSKTEAFKGSKLELGDGKSFPVKIKEFKAFKTEMEVGKAFNSFKPLSLLILNSQGYQEGLKK